MRCYCCDEEREDVRLKYGERLCEPCRREIHSTLQEYDDNDLILWRDKYIYTTTQTELNSTGGRINRKTPKPTLKQPDFDLYKTDDKEKR